jgi:hypothetical protein
MTAAGGGFAQAWRGRQQSGKGARSITDPMRCETDLMHAKSDTPIRGCVRADARSHFFRFETRQTGRSPSGTVAESWLGGEDSLGGPASGDHC